MKNFIVHISNEALMEMTIATMEAYVVPKASKVQDPDGKIHKSLETCGLLWGHELVLPSEDILFSVEKLTVDTMARRRNSSILPSNGIEVVKDLVTSYWPKYSLLGDFHSHPYKHYTEVNRIKGYQFSEQDLIAMLQMRCEDEDFRVGLVMTVASLEKSVSALPQQIKGNVVCWTFNNYRFWLTACVLQSIASEDVNEEEVLILPGAEGNYSDAALEHDLGNVILHIPYINEPWAAKKFGKINSKGLHTPA